MSLDHFVKLVLPKFNSDHFETFKQLWKKMEKSNKNQKVQLCCCDLCHEQEWFQQFLRSSPASHIDRVLVKPSVFWFGTVSCERLWEPLWVCACSSSVPQTQETSQLTLQSCTLKCLLHTTAPHTWLYAHQQTRAFCFVGAGTTLVRLLKHSPFRYSCTANASLTHRHVPCVCC